jgi:hypothetical protein
MRFLLSRTDALGDLIISLPVMDRILSRQPEAEIHWLVRAYTAPVLDRLPGVTGIHLRGDDADLGTLMAGLKPDAVLNLSHRDKPVISAAREADIPIRVARSRGSQIWEATHVLWKGRYGTGRHESQSALDFLKPWHWDGGIPTCPRLILGEDERKGGLAPAPSPTLGLALRGSGAAWVRLPRFVGDDGAPSATARRSRGGSGSTARCAVRSGGSRGGAAREIPK